MPIYPTPPLALSEVEGHALTMGFDFAQPQRERGYSNLKTSDLYGVTDRQYLVIACTGGQGDPASVANRRPA